MESEYDDLTKEDVFLFKFASVMLTVLILFVLLMTTCDENTLLKAELAYWKEYVPASVFADSTRKESPVEVSGRRSKSVRWYYPGMFRW